MSDLELQTLLDFDDKDLVANRDCRLSSRQKEKIKRAEQLQQRLLFGTGSILVLILAGNAFAVVSQVTSYSPASQPSLPSLAFGLGIPTVVLGFFAWSAFQYARNKADHSVQQVRGRVNFIKTEKALAEKMPNGAILYRRFEVYDLYIGTVCFENMNQKMRDILQAGDIYVLYYAKDTKAILSAERLAKGK